MVVDVMISKKIPPDKIFPRSYMDFEQKYQKDPSMNRVKGPQKKKKRLKYNRGKRWEGREGGGVGQKASVIMSSCQISQKEAQLCPRPLLKQHLR